MKLIEKLASYRTPDLPRSAWGGCSFRLNAILRPFDVLDVWAIAAETLDAGPIYVEYTPTGSIVRILSDFGVLRYDVLTGLDRNFVLSQAVLFFNQELDPEYLLTIILGNV